MLEKSNVKPRGSLFYPIPQEFTNKKIDIITDFCYNKIRSDFCFLRRVRGKRKGHFLKVNLKKLSHLSENVIKEYKESDPVMVRKAVSVKDIGYRKDDPSRELWHAEMSLDHDFYLATLLIIAGGAILTWGAYRVSRAVMCRRHRR